MAWNFGGGRRVVFLGWRGTWRGSMAVETLPIRYRAASPGRIELNRVSGLIYEMARSYGPRSGEPPGYELISSREGGASPRIAEATTAGCGGDAIQDRKSTRLNSSHVAISYAVFCLKKK